MALKKIGKWALRRLKEKSTWAGAAAVAVALGADKFGLHLDQVGQIVGIITGTALMAATTAEHPTAQELFGR